MLGNFTGGLGLGVVHALKGLDEKLKAAQSLSSLAISTNNLAKKLKNPLLSQAIENSQKIRNLAESMSVRVKTPCFKDFSLAGEIKEVHLGIDNSLMEIASERYENRRNRSMPDEDLNY